MYRVDIAADLNNDDGSGRIWAFLDEAQDPEGVEVGTLLVAGSEGAAAMCEVASLEPAADGGTIVHLRVLPGRVANYRDAAGRAVFRR
ncbi:MAG TPA: hypothetical protein VFB06_08280 [Streptosporangiaceae bacterium]|nr:hypothetical protein [Streptosporangiaceae bacterium]